MSELPEAKSECNSSSKKRQLKVKTRYQPDRNKSKLVTSAPELISQLLNGDNCSCKFCPALFPKENQLKNHIPAHLHKEVKCDTCDIALPRENKFSGRKKSHCEILKCKYCNTQFNNVNSFKLHIRLHTGEKPYVCNECDAKFVQSSHLSIHKRSHTGEKPYQCNICKQSFKQISHLRSHERIHTQTKPYSCEYCGKSFIQKSSLKRHIRIHTGERPYMCKVCEATFCVKNNLTRHMIVHTGEQPYSCDLCESSFSQPIDLRRHKIAHTGIKPYSCDNCKASFSRNDSLKWHKLLHTGEMPFKCDTCDSKFAKPKDLKKHKLTHDTPQTHNCSVCSQSFQQVIGLKKHMMMHLGQKFLPCVECDATFIDRNSLKRHKYKHQKQLKCSQCDFRFRDNQSLQNHMEIQHTSDKKFPSATENADVVSEQHLLFDRSDSEMDQKRSSEEILPTMSLPETLHQHSRNQFTSQEVQQSNITSREVQQSNITYSTVINFPAVQAVSQNSALFSIPAVLPQDAAIPSVLLSSGASQPVCIGKLGDQCANQSAHFLIVGPNNHIQNLCFCETANLGIENATSNTFGGVTELGMIYGEQQPGSMQIQHSIKNDSEAVDSSRTDPPLTYGTQQQLIYPIMTSHQVIVQPQPAVEGMVLYSDQSQLVPSEQYSGPQTCAVWLNS